MADKTRKRNRRGGVSVTTRNNILRLRWTYKRQKKQLSLQIPDSEENRAIAAKKAAQIEADIISGDYDESLDRYRMAHTVLPSMPELSTVSLFEQFMEYKRLEGVSGQALSSKYKSLRSNIRRLGKDLLTTDDARHLVALLRKRQAPRTANQNLTLLKSFGAWLVESGHFDQNLFDGIRRQKGAKASKQQDRTPFTPDELARFLPAMLLHPTASHYYDFTVLLFSLGLRPSEAIGLRWSHVDLVRRTVTIRESLSRGEDGRTAGGARQRKGTKSDNARTLPLNQTLVDILTARWSLDALPDDLIFLAVGGQPIDDRNYRNRYWKPICEAARIPYRPPYTARHTLISHGLEYYGWTNKQAAAIAGHTTTRMIEETYSHLMEMPEMPDITAP